MSDIVSLRCDGGPQMGLGHVYRCLGLAEALTDFGWRPVFASEHPTDSVASIIGGHFELIDVTGDEREQAAEVAKASDGHVAMAVVDHPALGGDYLGHCRPFADHLLAIDDTAQRRFLDCDTLLNPNLGAERLNYDGLVPQSCQQLLGGAYAPLRSAFAHQREASCARRRGTDSVQKVLVAFGGTDPVNATHLALKALALSETDAAIDVILSSAAPHLGDLQEQAAGHVRFHIDVPDPAPLLAAADVAIGAGGVSALERCVLGLPTVLVVIAENQRGLANALGESNAAVVAGDIETLNAADLADVLKPLLADPEARGVIAGNAAALCNGRGGHEVVSATIGTHRLGMAAGEN
ncbi:MAG: UDP-2,4-diacetamido-2,4,6-trideoxy-beta-L-altropyranose hydrolase [Pseudomonadota bacterium]